MATHTQLYGNIVISLILIFSVIHLGVSIGIIHQDRPYGDIFRPEIGLSSYNIVIGLLGIAVGVIGLIHMFTDQRALGQLTAIMSGILGILALVSLITALIINSKSASYVNTQLYDNMNQYMYSSDAANIIDRIQSNHTCCGETSWIDWARFQSGPTTVSTVISTSATVVVETSTISSHNTTTMLQINGTTALVMNTTFTSSTNTASTLPTQTNGTSSTNTASTLPTQTNGTSSTNTASTLPTQTNGTSSTSTASTFPLETTNTSSTNTASTLPTQTNGTSSTSTASTFPMETTNTSSTSTASTLPMQINNTSSASTTPALPTETTSTIPTGTNNISSINITTPPVIGTTTTLSQVNLSDTTSQVVSIARREINRADILSNVPTLLNRQQRQAVLMPNVMINVPFSTQILVPPSCCMNTESNSNNSLQSTCSSISQLHINGCLKFLTTKANQQDMGIGIINCFLIVLAFAAIPFPLPPSLHDDSSENLYSQQFENMRNFDSNQRNYPAIIDSLR